MRMAGTLRGTYLYADTDGLWLQTAFAAEPVRAGWINLLEVRPRFEGSPDPSLVKNGLVEHAGCHLHGRVVNGEGCAQLRWEAVHSRHPVAFLTTAHDTRAFRTADAFAEP